MDEGGAGGGVEEEEVDEGVHVGGIGVGGVNIIDEGGEYGVSGDGSVGIDNVNEMVDEEAEPLSIKLHAVDGDVTAGGGVAILAIPLQLAASVAGDCTCNAAGDVAAEDMVAAEGADGNDFRRIGGVGGGRRRGGIVELLALARGGFGGEEATVGG